MTKEEADPINFYGFKYIKSEFENSIEHEELVNQFEELENLVNSYVKFQR